ncbi:MAG: glycosyltransferase family 4 protein [Candidatus Magasanikbacteria bacterium]|nr:glycosyltransferase family 4 protein [Candidatus Magasanikbacteria bacterium]
MTKVAYIANIRLPTEKAHGVQIMKTCEGLSECGLDVTLIVPKRLNSIKSDPFEFYGVKDSFSILRLPCLDFVSLCALGPFGFFLESLSFFYFLKRYLKKSGLELYYTRDQFLADWLSRSGEKPVVFEIHSLPEKKTPKLYNRIWRNLSSFVVISQGLKNDLVAQGVNPNSILIARDAVDMTMFDIPEPRDSCREKLGIGKQERMLVYTGHLYGWKGADTLAESASLLPSDIHIYFVGGTQEDIVRFRKAYQSDRLHIVGWRPQREMPFWQKAADILVLPNSAKQRISTHYTSPLKLFEYMVSGRPMICSDIPSLREVLSDEEAVFFKPDDPASLAEAIEQVFKHFAEREKAANTLQLKARSLYGWPARARNIADFIRL